MAESEERETPVAGRDAAVSLKAGLRQDFTYRRFHGLRVKGIDLRRSLFIGALIEDCVFDDADFSRCDFSGTKIVQCVFVDCRFALADIRSCRFEDTNFTRCDLGTSQLIHTDSRGATFASCSFERATLLESTLHECKVVSCSFKGASVTAINFDHCSFADTGLADCTALFLFFDDCRFERFAINAETIGLTYGLGRRELDDIQLVHLGDGQKKPAGADLVELLATTYRARRWYVGAATLDLNFALTPAVLSVRQLAYELSALSRQGLPYDIDELAFFARVLERLEREGRLPLLAGRLFRRALRDIFSAPISEYDDRSHRLLARVDRLLLSMLDQACGLLQEDNADAPVTIEFCLSDRPARPLDALCLDVLHAVHGADMLEFVSGRDGSWIEVWQTVPSVLATVQLVLLAVNGFLKELNKAVENGRRLGKTMKGRKAPATKKTGAKRSRNAAALTITADDGMSTHVMTTRRRASLLSDEALRRVDLTLDVVETKPDQDIIDLQAYANSRVLAVAVMPARKATARSPRKRAPAA